MGVEYISHVERGVLVEIEKHYPAFNEEIKSGDFQKRFNELMDYIPMVTSANNEEYAPIMNEHVAHYESITGDKDAGEQLLAMTQVLLASCVDSIDKTNTQSDYLVKDALMFHVMVDEKVYDAVIGNEHGTHSWSLKITNGVQDVSKIINFDETVYQATPYMDADNLSMSS